MDTPRQLAPRCVRCNRPMSVIRVSDMCGQCKTDITLPPGNWGFENPRDPKFKRWQDFKAAQRKTAAAEAKAAAAPESDQLTRYDALTTQAPETDLVGGLMSIPAYKAPEAGQ